MEDCVVCFEKTTQRTICQHVVCDSCTKRLLKNECPYCRRPFPQPKTIILSFIEFTILFHHYYASNDLYQNLLMGKDDNCILKNDVLFYIRSKDNFDDRGIEIKIFDMYQERSYHSSAKVLHFTTSGLDKSESSMNEYRYSPASRQGQILENYIHSEEIFC